MKENFMKEIGLNKTGLNQLIKEGYEYDRYIFYMGGGK